MQKLINIKYVIIFTFQIISNNDVHWNKDNFVKVNAEANEEKGGGHGKISWESHKYSVRTLTFKHNGDSKNKKAEFDLALQWEGKSADVSVKADGTSNPIHLQVVSNVPEKGKFEVDLSHKVRKYFKFKNLTHFSATKL